MAKIQSEKPVATAKSFDLIYNAFQHSTDAILITDLNGVIIEINQAFSDIFGWSRDEAIGSRTSILRSPKTDDGFYQQMWQAINTHGEWKGEIINRRKDGSDVPVLTSITPIFFDGKKVGYMGVEIDISERKRLERRILREREFSASLIETADNLIVVLNPRAEIVLFNKKCERVTGYSKSEVIGHNWFELFLPESLRPVVDQVFRRVLSTREPMAFENAIVCKTGDERIIAWNNTTIFNDNHEVEGVLAIGQDVTQQKALEQQILRSERLATIGKMAAKVAHEIRNPLSSISLNAELLEDEIRDPGKMDPEEASSLLKSIIDEVDRLASLTEEYLQFSRLPEANPLPEDVTLVLIDVLGLIEPEANSIGIQVLTNFKPGLPKIIFDRLQFRRVLLNLIKNAIEAMPKGGVLSIHAEARKKDLCVSISDTGEGVREKDREKIFEPFFTSKAMGTGLGLAISRQIIEEHGGTLTCHPREQGGTTFRIMLPIRETPHMQEVSSL